MKVKIRELISMPDFGNTFTCDQIMLLDFSRLGISSDLEDLKSKINFEGELKYQCTVLLKDSLRFYESLSGVYDTCLGFDETIDYVCDNTILQLYEYDYNHAGAVIYTMDKEVVL